MSDDSYTPSVFAPMENLRRAQEAGETIPNPSEQGTSDASGPVEDGPDPDEFLSGNVDDVKGRIAGLGDDVDRQALIDAEKAGKNRKGVLDALGA